MRTVTKTFTFDAGHRLSNYSGKCRHLHGHTYKVEVTVVSRKVDVLGMVIDFGVLKEIAKKVDEKFDHKLILKEDDPYTTAIALALPENDGSLTLVSYNPTAENLAEDIYKLFESGLSQYKGVKVSRVSVYETPTSIATFEK